MTAETDKQSVISRPFEGVRFEASPKWIRVSCCGRYVADSRRAHLLFEPSRLPEYHFPSEDVRTDLLRRSERVERSEKGERTYWHVVSDGRCVEDGVWSYLAVDQGFSFLSGFFAFRWDAMDAWFEEDDEVFVHARDPYHRIDVRRSSRHLKVEHAGHVLAETRRPVLLFETGLPTRYYVPLSDVRTELLQASEHRTQCPYKGEAEHWSVKIDDLLHEDLCWAYRLPSIEVSKIDGLVGFYQERVDSFVVDGARLDVPVTPWSRSS